MTGAVAGDDIGAAEDTGTDEGIGGTSSRGVLDLLLLSARRDVDVLLADRLDRLRSRTMGGGSAGSTATVDGACAAADVDAAMGGCGMVAAGGVTGGIMRRGPPGTVGVGAAS